MRLPEETSVQQALVYALQDYKRPSSTHEDIDDEDSTIKTKYDVGRSMRKSSKQRFIIKTLFIVFCDIVSMMMICFCDA